ncbi:hypothetical protein IE077_004060 [Cardiosporidium cionae]|uniref:Uncharacterized protein n=1 Tax=Cardiosporidium cionae TaxID=476202 RepID=A0ABQ7J6V7_9APIC|nr:hypothetical protein IE077_004060 [Cardiosporidium cionae]|eukprot:KAF8819731.1 hypothetical protein IE077_004060 [Cardiosporidium cionae]
MDSNFLLSFISEQIGLNDFIICMERIIKSEIFVTELRGYAHEVPSVDSNATLCAISARIPYPPSTIFSAMSNKPFKLYDPYIAALILHNYKLLQRDIVQSYLTMPVVGMKDGMSIDENLKDTEESDSEAVAASNQRQGAIRRYKNLIKMQDDELISLRNENQLLKEEISQHCRKRTIEKSAALVDKVDAFSQLSNSLQEEVDCLLIESAKQSKCLCEERKLFALKLEEQQKQLEGVVLAYGNLETSYQIKEEQLILAKARLRASEQECQFVRVELHSQKNMENGSSLNLSTTLIDELREKSLELSNVRMNLEQLQSKHSSCLELLSTLEEQIPAVRPYVCSLSVVPSLCMQNENYSNDKATIPAVISNETLKN